MDERKNTKQITMEQQTAVEWLTERVSYHKLNNNLTLEKLYELQDVAKQMEKNQMKIELPSDEEIEKKLGTAAGGLFCKGAKWMRDWIKDKINNK